MSAPVLAALLASAGAIVGRIVFFAVVAAMAAVLVRAARRARSAPVTPAGDRARRLGALGFLAGWFSKD